MWAAALEHRTCDRSSTGEKSAKLQVKYFLCGHTSLRVWLEFIWQCYTFVIKSLTLTMHNRTNLLGLDAFRKESHSSEEEKKKSRKQYPNCFFPTSLDTSVSQLKALHSSHRHWTTSQELIPEHLCRINHSQRSYLTKHQVSGWQSESERSPRLWLPSKKRNLTRKMQYIILIAKILELCSVRDLWIDSGWKMRDATTKWNQHAVVLKCISRL